MSGGKMSATRFSREILLLMKVPIDDYTCLDLDAPTLPVHEIAIDGVTRFRVWRKHCRSWHYHGPSEGHRQGVR